MRAQAPQVLEPYVHIEKLPGISQEEETKHSRFCMCGDNVEKTVRRHFMRSDKGNTSLHYFQSYAVLNRVDSSYLSDEIQGVSSDQKTWSLVTFTNDILHD